MDWRFVVSLLFAVVVAIFAIQNADSVDVKFLAWSLSVSQALVILISAVFGAIVVMFLSIIRWVRMRSQIKSAHKEVAALEEVNQNLAARLEACTTKLEKSEAKADETPSAPGDQSIS